MKSNHTLTAHDLIPSIGRAVALASEKSLRLDRRWNPADGAPVITIAGQYTARSWTQWTQGFQFGSALLAFELGGPAELLAVARRHILAEMAPHVSHTGVHDHGFNNISTYGNLRRLILAGRADDRDLNLCELALKVSGAVQAARWTGLPRDSNHAEAGYIYSFNGRHSLFIDTMRTLRVCAMAHQLGHHLGGEQDASVNLLARLLAHADASARFNIYYGEGRDSYDTPALRGRTAHEAIFNPASGAFRCPSTQQGYSPFTTWTRGLAWAMLGFAEQLEFIRSLPPADFARDNIPSQSKAGAMLERAARATCDFYLAQASAADGICYWDTGAPNLHRLGDWRSIPADPFNGFEPVDSSASAIAAQGLLRLGHALAEKTYTQAGLTLAHTLLAPPYLSDQPDHEGLLLHSIYHRPNGWDCTPPGRKIPCGESSMWGDYHLLELMLLLTRIAGAGYYTFYGN